MCSAIARTREEDTAGAFHRSCAKRRPGCGRHLGGRPPGRAPGRSAHPPDPGLRRDADTSYLARRRGSRRPAARRPRARRRASGPGPSLGRPSSRHAGTLLLIDGADAPPQTAEPHYADSGVTASRLDIAETGTIVLDAAADQGRRALSDQSGQRSRAQSPATAHRNHEDCAVREQARRPPRVFGAGASCVPVGAAEVVVHSRETLSSTAAMSSLVLAAPSAAILSLSRKRWARPPSRVRWSSPAPAMPTT